MVKATYYDDQTPVWDKELKERRVLYPWRIELAFMAFPEEPIQGWRIQMAGYVDGYSRHELNRLLEEKRSSL
ncbi:MAG: hypothetical protein ACP5K1_04660 [Candidatus Bathyarchaeia archaeon]